MQTVSSSNELLKQQIKRLFEENKQIISDKKQFENRYVFKIYFKIASSSDFRVSRVIYLNIRI